MERQRKYKVFVVVALMFTIVALSVAFAAFSKVLTINASATVTPNEEDFKVVTYGFKDDEALNYFLEVYEFSDDLLSNEFGVGFIETGDEGTVFGTTANITNNLKNTTINDANVTFYQDGSLYKYYFILKNEGKYDAYINLNDFKDYSYKNQVGGQCIGVENQEEIDQACNNVGIDVYLESSNYENIKGTEEEPYYKLSIGDYVYLHVAVYVNGGAIISEPYSLNFDDLTINFSTAPPSNN